MKAEHLDIAIAVGGSSKAEFLYTLQLLLGDPSKAEYLRIAVAVRGPLETELLLMICFGLYYMS